MSTKYWVEFSGNEPKIARVDVTKETAQRVYFDIKSVKEILGRRWYTPSWQYKTEVRLFDTLEEAYTNCLLTFENMIARRQKEISEIESLAADTKLRIAALKRNAS